MSKSKSVAKMSDLTYEPCLEVVLSQLVSIFRFDLPEKQEIIWRFGGITSPSVRGSNRDIPELPLRVSLVQ